MTLEGTQVFLGASTFAFFAAGGVAIVSSETMTLGSGSALAGAAISTCTPSPGVGGAGPLPESGESIALSGL